jgi:hypothetical protein
MKGKNFRNKALVGGLALALLGGCSSTSKTMKRVGGGLGFAGNITGSSGLTKAGGAVSVGAELVKLAEMASYEMPEQKGLTFDNFVYVGDKSDFPINDEGFLVGDFDGVRGVEDINVSVDYSPNFVVTFNTENYHGEFLEASISAKKVVRKGLFGKKEYGGSEIVRIFRREIGENENYVFWQPFENGASEDTRYFVHGIVTGDSAADCIGSCFWEFNDFPEERALARE